MIWKDIEGFEGLYQVSNTGLVKSIRLVGKSKRVREIILKEDKQVTKHSTYLRVTLSKEGKAKRFSVHRLVALAFIPNPENKPFVNHIDNDASNNNVQNLEWVTHSENMIHAEKQGRLFEAQSAGGTKAGQKAKEKVENRIRNMVGSSFGSWTVISEDYEYRGRKYYVTCKCVCGTSKKVEHGRLLRKETLGCSSRCH